MTPRPHTRAGRCRASGEGHALDVGGGHQGLPPAGDLPRRDLRRRLHQHRLRLHPRLRPARGVPAALRDRRLHLGRRRHVHVRDAGDADGDRHLRHRRTSPTASGPATSCRISTARSTSRPTGSPTPTAARSSTPSSVASRRSSSGSLVFHLRLPGNVGTWVAFVVSVAIAVAVSFGWGFLLQLTAVLAARRARSQPARLADGTVLRRRLRPGRVLPCLARHDRQRDAVPVDGAAPGRGVPRQASRLRAGRRVRRPAPVGGGAVRRGTARAPLAPCARWSCKVGELTVYRRLVGARIRADLQYRTSFFLFLISQTLVAGLDLAVIAVLFTQVDSIAGWSGDRSRAALRRSREQASGWPISS